MRDKARKLTSNNVLGFLESMSIEMVIRDNESIVNTNIIVLTLEYVLKTRLLNNDQIM